MPRTATTTARAAVPGGEAVATLERGLTVVRLLAAERSGRLSRADLVRATGLARSSLDRVAATLRHLGYLRAEGQDLLPAPRLMEFGNAYLAASRIPALLGPLAHRLADRLDESVSISVPDRDGARFVVQCPRRRAMAVTFQVGDLLPAERCAPGALFAADWDEEQWAHWRRRLRTDPLAAGFLVVPPHRGALPGAADFESRARRAGQSGLAVDDQLVEPGLVAVALPVTGPDGAIVCALSVVSHTSRHTADSLRKLALPLLRTSAGAMERALADPSGADLAAEPPAVGPAVRGAAQLRAAKDEIGPEFLQSLARGLSVLTSLRTPGGLTLTEAAQATGLARATARRALLALCDLGYASGGSDMRRFTLQPRVLELGYAAQAGLTFERLATPYLADLVRRVHDSSSVAVLDGVDIRYVARVATTRVMGVDLAVGTRLPASATAMGRVLLAGMPSGQAADLLARSAREPLNGRTLTELPDLLAALDRARTDGFALVDQELEAGLRSLAVPVHDRAGDVVAALNVAVHAAHRTSDDLRTHVLPELAATARLIEDDLAAATEWLSSAAPLGRPAIPAPDGTSGEESDLRAVR
ncbi:IclR family transcriptional regulator C-terminal domain-containing protein [Streptomyces sp. 549]|uniref:IclR family transcriptional regulator domain-containing protein n=1 Tax=Streptomyces sp. 549 TaxID=3049076 RepID=UPI0024C3AC97|nr:IclR family transcriptional regulator C-terminal domain-containing protein [Streptomyces sp. 549]MDK1471890.1 IclR family transcriptional regulator C-terminal domain-containing protein [Streptomyces sp. 549]